MNRNIIILGILFLGIVAINYPLIYGMAVNSIDKDQTAFVGRITDGTTLETNLGTVKLLSINAPQKNDRFYKETKEFIESNVLNKTVKLNLQNNSKDPFNRIFAYVLFENKNLNLEIVRNGFANYHFSSRIDPSYNKFHKAWLECLEVGKNLCEKSEDKCSSCIILKDINVEAQEIVFYNQCDFSCDLDKWEIKNDGRKKFVFQNFSLKSKKSVIVKVGEDENDDSLLFWRGEESVFESEDTLFLRDSNYKLVLWNSY